jgi:hypothetical protein
MKIAHEIIQTVAESWLFFFTVIVLVIAVVVYLRSRKQILFESWVNMYDSKDADRGRSVADLLLFKIGFIKSVHQRSAGSIGNWNIYRDVPAFRQSLDEDVKLLASVDVGKYGSFATAISALLFRLLPMVFRPARLQGSIHKYGDRLQLLATLNSYSQAEWRTSATTLWEVIQENSSPERLPDAVEELAFRIYLDLTREELFKSWEGFQAYTNGLANYISYVDLQRKTDYDKAKAGYEQARQLEPNNPAISYSRGVLEYYQWDSACTMRGSNAFAMHWHRRNPACVPMPTVDWPMLCCKNTIATMFTIRVCWRMLFTMVNAPWKLLLIWICQTGPWPSAATS